MYALTASIGAAVGIRPDRPGAEPPLERSAKKPAWTRNCSNRLLWFAIAQTDCGTRLNTLFRTIASQRVLIQAMPLRSKQQVAEKKFA